MSNSRSGWSAKRNRRATHIPIDQPGVLDMHRRWYGAIVATLLAGGLVIGGLTPAVADDAAPTPAPVAEESATPDPSPTPESDAATKPTPEPSETTPEPEPAPEPSETTAPPAQPAPVPSATTAPPAPEPSESATPEPSESAAPEPSESAAPEPSESAVPVPDKGKTTPPAARAADPGISLLALLPDCVGNSCGQLTVDVVVSGGTATASMWEVRATNTATTDYYILQDNVTKNVQRNNPSSYQLSWTSSNPATAPYTSALTCSESGNNNQNTRVRFNSGTSTVTFYGTDNNRRSSNCTLTFTAPPAPVPTTITTYVAGDRSGLNALTGLPGATLELWTGTSSGPTAVINQPWATCTSAGADGKCVFTIPNANDPSISGSQLWIVQKTAPVGWRINTAFNTGSSGSSVTTYAARTAAISPTPQDSRVDFMIGTGDTNSRASGGTFVMSRDNITRNAACGVRVALLFDLSGSLSGQLTNIKTAGKAMVTALEGTNSSVGVYTFANSAPATSGGTLASTAVSTTAGANTVRNHIDTFTTPTGATNWDRGLSQIPNDYDVVLIITDGNPTRYGNSEGPGDYTRFREVENGALSANKLKSQGMRVVAVGVGDGIDGPSNNLAAISGPTAGSDFFQSPTFDAAAQEVRKAALGDCLGSLTVVKQVVPQGNQGENVTGATPAGGWTFNAASQTANLAVGNGGTGVSAPVTGAVNFPLTYTGGLSIGTVRVNEVVQSGYGIVTQSGKNAVCTATTITGATSNVPVTNQTVGANPGFDVAIPNNASVSCVVYNKPSLVQTSITVDKVWVINGVEYTNATNPLASEGVSATLQLAGTNQAWNTPRGNIVEGTSVAISETVAPMPTDLAQCSYGGVSIVNAAGTTVSNTASYTAVLAADPSANSYKIKNTVTCAAQLTLIKSVANGQANPADWTLTAHAPDGALAGPSGPTTVTGTVTPMVRYALGETGSALYRQFVDPNATIESPSTGSWACVQLNSQGAVVPGFNDGLNGGVIVPLGYHVRCTAVNETSSLVLLKQVINDNGGTATESNFTLTATPAPLAGLANPAPVAGATTASAANTIPVRPEHVYTLSESSMAGYQFVKLQQFVGGSWVDVTANADPQGYPRKDAEGNWMVTVSPQATNTYRFVNDDQAPTIELRKAIVNAYGSNGNVADWSLTAESDDDGSFTGTSGTSSTVTAGVGYTLSEDGPAGWTRTGLSCTSGLVGDVVTAQVGQTVICTFTNTAQPASLTLVKSVDNTNVTTGGAEPSDWNQALLADNGTELTFDHNETALVNAGTYTLDELDDVVSGYSWTDLTCDGNASAEDVDLQNPSLTIANGESVICTFENTATAPTITLEKVVLNTNGGSAVATDWTLSAVTEGPRDVTGTHGVSGTAQAGQEYTLSEDGPNGYSLTNLTCSGLPDVTKDSKTFTLLPGQNTTCTFTNTSVPAGLTLTKVVNNDNGGSAVPANWDQKLTATPTNGATIPFDSGETLAVSSGTYTLAELAGPAGYTLTGITCGGVPLDLANPWTVTVANGQNVECIFTNASVAPTITLVKALNETEFGGPAEITDWTLSATAGASDPSLSGQTGVTGALKAGVQYTLDEVADAGISGYELETLACDNGVVVSGGDKITLNPGQSTTCTFTNKSLPGELTITKIVDDVNGGTAVAEDWDQLLHATDGSDVQTLFDSGETIDVAAGTYVIGEGPAVDDSPLAQYELVSIVCDGVTLDLADPSVDVANGESVSCEVTNRAIAPQITLVKTVDTSEWGGSADATSWLLSATGGADDPAVSGRTGTPEASGAIKAGVTYTLAETEGTDGFALTSLTCTDGVAVSADDTITMQPGQTTTCTFVNSSVAGGLKLVKTLDLTNGGNAVATDWNQKLVAQLGDETPIPFNHEQTISVDAGVYTLSEINQISGYELTDLSCVGQDTSMADPTVTVTNGVVTTCTFENSSIAPQITLVKVVDTSVWGGSADAAAWLLSAEAGDDDPAVSGRTGTPEASGAIKAGVAYTLTETQGVSGFALTSLACTNGVSVSDAHTITMQPGQTTTCTFTNASQPGSLTLNKSVDLTNGGDAVATDWNQKLIAQLGDGAPVAFDHAETQQLPAGSYALSEIEQLTGYALTDLSCVGQDTSLANPMVTVTNGGAAECTFVNSSIAPEIDLVKVTESPFREPADASLWTLSATTAGGPNLSGSTGATGDVKALVEYMLTEDEPVAGYELTSLVCEGHDEVSADNPYITLSEGETTTCTFTNTEQPGSLTLYKDVDNTNGGAATAEDWNQLLAASMGDTSLTFDHGETMEVAPGTWMLDELTGGPSGYAWTGLSCDEAVRPDFAPYAAGITSLENPTVEIGAGEEWLCWFTNESQKPMLTLEKEIDNTGGGLASADDWTLTASTEGGTLISGTGTMVSDTVAAISGTAAAETPITLGEMGPSGYVAGDWACVYSDTDEELYLEAGMLWLEIGDDVTCRIVNSAIPATGSVDKQVTSSAQNADGTWTVEYEITVTNQSEFSGYEYSLSDTLLYGAGIEVLDATWTGNGMTDQPFADDGTATLATDAVIDPPFGTEVYTVTVNANVTAAAYTDGTNWCDPQGGEAGGFLNTAMLTDDNDGGESRACSEPFAPEVDKSTESVVDNGDGTYTLTYALTVQAPLAPEGETVFFDLTDELNLPDGVEMVGDATATAVGTAPAPTNASFDGEGVWTIVDNGSVGSEALVYNVTVTLSTSAAAVGAEPVCGTEAPGIAIGNTGTVISGSYEQSDDVCDVVHYDDMSIDKTAGLGEDQTSVQPGDTFDYVLSVTNNGSRPATDVLVTDTSINDRLSITGIAVTDGYTWTPEAGYEDNDVALTIDSIGAGETVTITVTVTFTMPETVTVEPSDGLMPTPVPIEELTNEACVATERDQNPDNDCDNVTIPVRDIAAAVTAVCVGDAPFLHWTVVKSETLRDEDVTLFWAPNALGETVPPSITITEPGGSLTWTDQITWPGTEFTPSGVSIDYPGWRPLQASDFAPGGGYYIPGTATVMTAQQQDEWVFNGLILDPSELDYAWRLDTTVTISVNPSLTFTATYPDALPDCAVARHSEVEVEKTASVEKAMPGDNISYTIAVANVSDDSAAEDVVVTDEIPANLKVTDVTWPGEGDESVFPNWESCDITGSNAQGYGGTITCTLFGPLQPVGVGTFEAPTLTIKATVSSKAPAGQITNVAIVDYHTFGDPDDKGRDSDDAVVTIGAANKPLPATGGPVNGTWVILGLLGVLGGTLLLISRRRRGEVRAQL